MIPRDTHPEIEAKYRQLLMSKTPSERLVMGCAMFDTARAFVVASIHTPGGAPEQERMDLFRRLYGRDVSAEFMEKLFQYWKSVNV